MGPIRSGQRERSNPGPDEQEGRTDTAAPESDPASSSAAKAGFGGMKTGTRKLVAVVGGLLCIVAVLLPVVHVSIIGAVSWLFIDGEPADGVFVSAAGRGRPEQGDDRRRCIHVDHEERWLGGHRPRDARARCRQVHGVGVEDDGERRGHPQRARLSMPARRLALDDRGVLRFGVRADLVIFDPEGAAERSSFNHGVRPTVGIAGVWLGGVETWSTGKADGPPPGPRTTPFAMTFGPRA